MEKPVAQVNAGAAACTVLPKNEGGKKTIVIRLSLEQLLRSGQDTIEIRLEYLSAATTTESPVQETRACTGFFAFMEGVIRQLKGDGKERTAEAYRAALCSLRKYRREEEVGLGELTQQMMEGYEAWLRRNDVKLNSCSFYMRILRAVYNRAVKRRMVADAKPFSTVYTGNARTAKRAVDLDTIRRIETLPLDCPKARFARDMFLFSFYTRGMSFVDMAYLRKDDLRDGVLSYCRRKTGQRLTIRWERQMQQIADRNPPANGPYLLPVIRECNGKERGQYRHRQRRINEELSAISKTLGLPKPLTMYVARHSWASIAYAMHTPLGVISQAMGHDSEKTTQIYLKELDNGTIDDLNKRILSQSTLAEDNVKEL